jgi:hypothetical protein
MNAMNEDEIVTAKTRKALRIAGSATLVALVLATILLIKETPYTFVVFMFLGPPLILVAAVGLGWVILQDLKRKKVL